MNKKHVRLPAFVVAISLAAAFAFQAHAGTLSVTNGSFADLTGLTVNGGGWYGGVPAGWTTDSGASGAYTVLNSGGTYYANLGTLGPTSPFTPLRQNVGTVDITSDVVITFTLTTLSGTSGLGSGIYDLALTPYTSALASYNSGPITSASTVSYTARGVGPGTSLYIAFWNTLSAAGISGVSIADTATTYLWNGGVSGVWTNGGSGWTDQFDSSATTYNNAKPVVAQFTNASAGTNVTVAANGVVVGNVQVGGTSDYTFSDGLITMTNTTWSVAANRTANVGSSLAGTTGLTKSDSGTLALGASNSYSGTTAVNAGTLTITDGNALGSAAAGTTVANGAQLRLTATNSGFTVGNEALTISGDGVSAGGALRSAAGINTWQGKVTLAANAAIGSASGSTLTLDVASGNAIEASDFSLTFVGAGTNVVNDAISLGTGSLTKIGSGLAVLAVSNSYSGGTTISLGTLRVQNATALGSGAVTVNGGTLDLGGNNLTTANFGGSGGTVSLGAATLTASNTSGSTFAGAITGTGGLVKTGSSYLTLSGSNNYSGGTMINAGTIYLTGSGTVGTASGSITISNADSTATLDLRNAQTRTGTITMIGQGARLASGDVNNPGSVINNGNALEFGGGQITVSVSGTGGLNVTGGGTINSSNSYTGATTISGTTGWYGTDQLFVNNANALGAASGDLTISGGTVNLQSNTMTRSGNVTVSGGIIENGTLSKSGSNFVLQGGVVNASLAGTAGLIKSTTNGASLNAANSYTGGTTISGGTLYVGSSGTLGDASSDVTVSGTGSGATLVVLDLRNQQTRTGTIMITNQDARIITGGGGSIVNNGVPFQFGGGSLELGVSGTGGMLVTGGGSISSSNSYTGATTISGTAGWYGTDTFFVANTNALGSASADLTISGGTVSLMSNTITRSGNVTISGGYVHTGTISKSGGNYNIQAGVIEAVLAGTAGLTKSGNGTLVLSGNNTYSGGTSISNGVVSVSADNSLGTVPEWPTAGNVTLNLGTLLITESFSMNTNRGMALGSFGGTIEVAVSKAFSYGGIAAGNGALTKSGNGTFTLYGANTFSGATTVSAGTLELASMSGSALNSTASVSVVSGAALLISQNNQVNDGASVTLSGGTIQRASGVSEVFGNLNLTQASFLNFGTGATGTLSFGTYAPSALTALNIVNFTQGNALTFFGSDLTPDMTTGAFAFSGSGGLGSYSWDSGTSTFTITAIPEASTIIAAAGLLGLMLWPSRRVLRRNAKIGRGLCSRGVWPVLS